MEERFSDLLLILLIGESRIRVAKTLTIEEKPFSWEVSALVSVTTVIIVVCSLVVYNLAFATVNQNGRQLVITKASFLPEVNGHYSLSLITENQGEQTAALALKLQNQTFLAHSDAFTSPVISRGETASYNSKIASVGHFDGSSGTVLVTNSASLNSTTLSVEFAFQYMSLAPDNQMILGKGASSGNSFYFFDYRALGVLNDFVVYVNNTRYDQQLGDIFALNSWYDVIFVLDGSSIDAYVNGNLVQSWQRAIKFEANNNDLMIGSCVCGGYYFNGSIAFVRYYNRALTAAEATSNYEHSESPVQDGLAMWLSFNSILNGNYVDLSGKGNVGIPTGGINQESPIVRGLVYTVTVIGTNEKGFVYSTSKDLIAGL